MTFLNPLVLFGLLTAAIPILLHIFNLRKLKTIEFSTLSFLKELQKTKIRRVKIRQILLLILRTLLVLLIVFAFSRPALKGSISQGFGSEARTSAVFIIDDSYSMTSLDENGELLKQAKQTATETIDLLKDGDDVFLLRLSESGSAFDSKQIPSFRGFAALRSVVKEIRPSYLHRDLDAALRMSAKLLSASQNFNKEVYVFSDLQSGIFETTAPHIAVSQNLFPPEVRFFFVPLGSREIRNASVDAVSIPNAIFEPNKAFSVVASVTNHSGNTMTNALVSVFVASTRVAQKGITLGAGRSADVELLVVPKSPGILEGIVALEDDDLEFDNRRYFTVTIPQELHVLLVGTPQDLRYIRLALAARSSSSSSTLRISESISERVTTNQIASSDVIVLSNVRTLSPAQLDRLRAFLEAGGGLILFPGFSSQPATFNSLFSSFRIPALTQIEGHPAAQVQSFLEFEKTDMRHPIFAGMFEEQFDQPQGRDRQTSRSHLESPKVKVLGRFVVNAQSLPVIALSNGAPFLIDQKLPQGRVLLFSVAANLEWSDFPVKGLFVPLLHRSVSYLAQEQSKTEPVLVGDEVVLTNIRGEASRYTLQDPLRNAFTIQPSVRGLEKTIRFSDTFFPGTYSVKAGSNIVRTFAVNVHPDESRTQKVENRILDAMLARLGIEITSVYSIRNPLEIRPTVLESRYGVELWKYFLIAALVVAALEMFIARDSNKEIAEFVPQSA